MNVVRPLGLFFYDGETNSAGFLLEEEFFVQFGFVNSVSELFQLLAMFDGEFEIILQEVLLKCEKQLLISI